MFLRITTLLLVATSAFPHQSHAAVEASSQLPAHATLPITFTRTVNASSAKPGDSVEAKTMQAIRLVDGSELPAGAIVTGHVLTSAPFHYDKTPYAKQSAGILDIQLDTLNAKGVHIPLHVSVRAMADPTTSWHASEPKSSDLDPLGTTTQIGGDLLTPSQSEIRNADGDIVGYNKRGGAFAHLIANSRGPLNCDAGDTEQPVSMFSASACGLYGFAGASLTDISPSHIGLSSTHGAPQIWKHSTALLEVLPDDAEQK